MSSVKNPGQGLDNRIIIVYRTMSSEHSGRGIRDQGDKELAEKKPEQPTQAELEVLKVLWGLGPSTVRQVWDELDPDHALGYTTVLKHLQGLRAKGCVSCDDSARSHIYRAKVSEKTAQSRGAKELIKKLFRGSAQQLMLRVLSEEKSSREELLEIRGMIDQLVRKK